MLYVLVGFLGVLFGLCVAYFPVKNAYRKGGEHEREIIKYRLDIRARKLLRATVMMTYARKVESEPELYLAINEFNDAFGSLDYITDSGKWNMLQENHVPDIPQEIMDSLPDDIITEVIIKDRISKNLAYK